MDDTDRLKAERNYLDEQLEAHRLFRRVLLKMTERKTLGCFICGELLSGFINGCDNPECRMGLEHIQKAADEWCK